MKNYSLRLFTNAVGPAREKSRFTYLNFFGQKVDIPYIIWNIAGADKNILIDAGCSAADYTRIVKGSKTEELIANGETFKDVQDVTGFEDGLAAWGLKPADIDYIIMTHLHRDHVMNTVKCKNAKIVVQEAEWKDAMHPHPLMKWGFAPRSFYDQLQFEFVKGDVEFMPGIRLIHTPGHTAGGQAVAVQTSKGWYAITGSCVVNDNFYPPESVKKATGHPIIPVAVHSDSFAAYESGLKLLHMFGDKILPSHEQSFMKLKQIP